MGTKSRNIRYSVSIKTFAVFLMCLSFAGLYLAFLFAVSYNDEISQQNYYQTTAFQHQIRQYAGHAADLAVEGYEKEEAAKILNESVNFKYIIKDAVDKTVATNMETA